MNRRRALSSLVAGVLGAIAATPCAARAAAGQAEPRAYIRGRLFRIERAGIAASYAFGTLHSSDARVIALPAVVVAALDASRAAAFESLLDESDLATFVAAAQYEDGRRLTDHVDAATFARIRAALEPVVPEAAMLERAKPWAVLLLLAQSRETGAASLDAILKAEARLRSHSVFPLELPDEQVASLDAIPLASQLALLRWALETQHARAAELEATTRAWLAGDLGALWTLALAPARRDPALAPHLRALRKHVVTDRNALLAHRLHLPLRRGRVFVAVGALHLHGADGLLALVARQGYRITRIV